MHTYLFASVENTWLLAGWTMLHFLWLGTLVALAALPVRWLLRRASANVRYVTALACLATLAALPVAIAAWLHVYSPSLRAIASPIVTNDASQIATMGQVQATDLKRIEPIELNQPLLTQNNETHSIAQPTPLTAQSTDTAIAVPTLVTSAPTTTDAFTLAVVAINTSVHYLPWLWLIGTPITFALTATGLLGTRRLRRASRPITDGPITEALEKLATSLRITRRIVVATCDRIAAPVLIGILRPIILLPPAALTGYSPDEIEMVLLHELAHVRRWDNLANLIQRLVESLLFFHPAVWLVSSWVRRERETCCDALVVTRTDHPHAYAELLVALAAQMPRSVLFHPAASSAMAAGPLRSRIRRILKLDDDPMLISGKSFTLMVAALLAAAVLAVVYLPSIGQAEQSQAKANENTDALTPAKKIVRDKEKAERLETRDRSQKRLLELQGEIKRKYEEYLDIAKGMGRHQSNDQNPEIDLLVRDIADVVKKVEDLTAQFFQLQTDYVVAKGGLSDPKLFEAQAEEALRQDSQYADLLEKANAQAAPSDGSEYLAVEKYRADFKKKAVREMQSKPNAPLQQLTQRFRTNASSMQKQIAQLTESLEQKRNELEKRVEKSVDLETRGEELKQLQHIVNDINARLESLDIDDETQTKNNLKNQMLALLNYEAAHNSFPTNAIYSPEGKRLLSWRVALLPFIDPKLYDEFHRDEPWDSEHNRKLIARMPDIFKNRKLDQPGKTNYLAVVGDECFMTGTPKKLGLRNITDGTSLTIALVEADPNQAVEWTRPLDWKFDRDRPTQGLGKVWDNCWYHTRVDGSVHRVDNSEPADQIGIHFTRAGGETESLQESANQALAGGAAAGEQAAGPEGKEPGVLVQLAVKEGTQVKAGQVIGKIDDSEPQMKKEAGSPSAEAGAGDANAKSDQPRSSDTKSLLFGIDPTKEPSDDEAKSLAQLFRSTGVVNPVENRNYDIPIDGQKTLQIAFDSINHGPLHEHMPFEIKWDDSHAHIAITAPKLALDFFFDPIVQALQSPRANETVLLTWPDNWDQSDTNRQFREAVAYANRKNLRVETTVRDGKSVLIGTPLPTESEWPAILGEPPQKDRVIAEKAWQRLGLKLLPTTGLNPGLRIVGGNLPKGLPRYAFLTTVDGTQIAALDDLVSWLESESGRSEESVKCYALSDQKEYLFYAKPTNSEVGDKSRADSDLGRAADAVRGPDASLSVDSAFPADANMLALTLKRGAAGKVDLWLDGKPIDEQVLRARIPQDKIQNASLHVSLAADPGISYEDVMRFVDLIESLGVKKLALDTRNVKVSDAQLKSLFTEREDNLIQTRIYEVHPSIRKTLPNTFEGLQKDPFGPQLKFEAKWNADHSKVEITAPKAAQDILAAELKMDDSRASGLITMPRSSVKSSESGLGAGGQFPSRSDYFDKSTSQSPPKLQIYFFYSPTSEPSVKARTAVQQVVKQFSDVKLNESDVSRESEQVKHFVIDKVPTCLIVRDGEVVRRIVGLQHEKELHKEINDALSIPSKTPIDSSKASKAADKPQSTTAPSPNPTISAQSDKTATPKHDTKTTAPVITGIVPNTDKVKLSDGNVASIAIAADSRTPAGGRSQVTRTPAASVFVAYDIPQDLKDKVLKYFSKSGVRTMADDRGRFIVQAAQPWHDNFAALLKAAPKWPDPAATKERPAAPVVMKKVNDEDILEWRSVGLAFKRNTERRSYSAANRTGVAVAAVDPGSTAAWADIRPGDVLTEIGSFKAGTMPEVQSLLKALGDGLQSKKRVPVKFYRQMPNGSTFVDADFTLGPEDLGAKPAEPQNSQPSAGTKPGPARVNKAHFHYDGISFDAWRTAWKTELSTEKRIEAVKALAAFGANGYGREAAESILDVADQYDWVTAIRADGVRSREPEGKLQKAVSTALVGGPGAVRIDPKYWLPLLRQRYEAYPDKWQQFAIQILPNCAPGNEKEKSEIEAFLLLLAQSQDEAISEPAVDALVAHFPGRDEIRKLLTEQFKKKDRWLSAVKSFGRTREFPPEVVDVLLHGDPEKQTALRKLFYLQMPPGDARWALVAKLTDMLKDDANAADHLATIRALGALARSEKVADTRAQEVLKGIVDKGPREHQVAAACALQLMTMGKTQAVPVLDGKVRTVSGEKLSHAQLQALVSKEQVSVIGPTP